MCSSSNTGTAAEISNLDSTLLDSTGTTGEGVCSTTCSSTTGPAAGTSGSSSTIFDSRGSIGAGTSLITSFSITGTAARVSGLGVGAGAGVFFLPQPIAPQRLEPQPVLTGSGSGSSSGTAGDSSTMLFEGSGMAAA